MRGSVDPGRLLAAYADEAGVLRAGDLFALGVLFVDDPKACEYEIRMILNAHHFSKKSVEWKVSDKRLVPVYLDLIQWFWNRPNIAYSALVFSQLLGDPTAYDPNHFRPIPGTAKMLAPEDALYNHLFSSLLRVNARFKSRDGYELHFERRSEAQSVGLSSYLRRPGHGFNLTSATEHRKPEGLRLLQFTDLLTSALRRTVIDCHWPGLLPSLVAPSKIEAVRLIRDHICVGPPEVRYLTYPSLQMVKRGTPDRWLGKARDGIEDKFNIFPYSPPEKRRP